MPTVRVNRRQDFLGALRNLCRWAVPEVQHAFDFVHLPLGVHPLT